MKSDCPTFKKLEKVKGTKKIKGFRHGETIKNLGFLRGKKTTKGRDRKFTKLYLRQKKGRKSSSNTTDQESPTEGKTEISRNARKMQCFLTRNLWDLLAQACQ